MGNTGYQVHPNFLFWIRLKTLHFNNQFNRILQIAYIFTDMKLNICQLGSHLAIHCPKQDFQSLHSNQLKFFKQNGLYQSCIDSEIGIEAAEEIIMKDIEFRKIARGQLLAAGKQAHLAKYALMQHMPKLYDFLHYRIFDLDSVKLVVERFKNPNSEQISNASNGDKNQELKKRQQNNKSVEGRMKRADEEVWQDIHQMQFYYQHALNDN